MSLKELSFAFEMTIENKSLRINFYMDIHFNLKKRKTNLFLLCLILNLHFYLNRTLICVCNLNYIKISVLIFK